MIDGTERINGMERINVTKRIEYSPIEYNYSSNILLGSIILSLNL